MGARSQLGTHFHFIDMRYLFFLSLSVMFGLGACDQATSTNETISKISPKVVTDTLPHDSDDPAFWIHPEDPSKSLVIGNDKEADGGIYAFDLDGKIVRSDHSRTKA